MVLAALCFPTTLPAATPSLAKQATMNGFRQCLMSTPATLGHCLGIGALTQLQAIDSNPEFDVLDGVTFARDEQQVRESYNFGERDPGDFRTIVDSVGQVFSRRTLKWDMSYFYPGLAMRVAPSLSPGGILEFVLDPHREVLAQHTLKEASTGRLLARQFLLPFLLGFKFNVASLIPIIFGILAVIAKKVVFVSKIGLLISSAIGLGSLLFGSNNKPTPPYYHHQHRPGYGSGHGGGYGGGYGSGYGHIHYRVPAEGYGDVFLRAESEPVEDPVGAYNEIQDPLLVREENKNTRNFAWSETDKMKRRADTKN